ncbi:protein ABHD11 isoform X2 [Pangasianodon hypophthalmus]|uniref:protein ABHD11 isoform X2 n=1 Tax=Pangasianodon hypophthalmus TaxID=310915 RepID=UPI00230830E5|nr:protein ABHD11 isoform X2 [Pangasianodon hypophthalmus]
MSFLCRLLTRGLLTAQPQRPTGAGAQWFCSGVSRLDAAQRDSAANSTSPVSLSYDVYDGKEDGIPLVFLHGLFGSKSNFHSIAKSLVQRTGRKPSLVERLVVVDISPVPTSARTFMRGYIEAMKEVKIPSNIPRSTARRVAEDQLRNHVKEHSIRHFLLTNLVEQNGHYAWRINLEAISNHLMDLMGFPKFNTTYDGPTLFLGGSNSEYLSSEDYPEIQRLFPCADIQYIPDASHWLHADKPLEFISSIITFVQS